MVCIVNMRRILMMLLLAVWCVTANAQLVSYASRQLEQMAVMLQATDSIHMLPEGLSYACLTHKGHPLTVVKREGRVCHIGYSVFTPQLRSVVGEVRANFIERFLLTTDLPFKREKTLAEEMQEEKILFRTGSLTTLKGITADTLFNVVTSLQNGRLHVVKWMKSGRTICEMGFPADHELLLGRNMLENDERMQMDILTSSDSILSRRQQLDEADLQKHDEVYVLSGKNFLNKELSARRYFTRNTDGSFSSLCTPKLPRESLANLLTAADIANNYTLDITLKQFNYQQSTFAVPLTKWTRYCIDRGFIPYFCIISETQKLLDALLIMHHPDLGCCHVMRLKFDPQTLANRTGVITARLNAFVPISNVKDLYYESKQK